MPPIHQTAALIRSLGGPLEFVHDYPVPNPGANEILAKVLYTGVCQSDLHTARGTASGADGKPITAIKLPHIGGHEGVGRIVSLGPGSPSALLGKLVGIRFASRICRRCEYCLAGTEQYCQGWGNTKPTNHLHHEDGAFQEWVVLDAGYVAILPDVGAGGGLGQYAVQYAQASGARVIGVDTGAEKRRLVEGFGAHFVDFKQCPNIIEEIQSFTKGGADSVIVSAGSSGAFAQAASMLKIGGTMCCIGIPPGGGQILTSVAEIVIKGLKIKGNLVGNLKECLEAVEQVRTGLVKPRVIVRPFRELPMVYEELEKGGIAGRVVLKIGDDPGPDFV